MPEWTEKTVPPKRQPLLRAATMPEQILVDSYIIPKADAERLLEKAMREMFGELDIDYEESVKMSITVLEHINKYLSK